MREKAFKTRIEPYINNGIGYIIVWILITALFILWPLLRDYSLILSVISLVVIYLVFLRLDLKVIRDVIKKDYNNDSIKIMSLKPDNLIKYDSNELFSFTYVNPAVQRFKIKVLLLSSNELVNLYMYLTFKEVNDGFNLSLNNKIYEITYLAKSGAILSARESEFQSKKKDKRK